MILLMLMAVGLVAALSVLAYTLALYALPFMLGVAAARLAYATEAGVIGAGVVGLVAGGLAYGLLGMLFLSLRSPVPRLMVALLFSVPAAVAGFALVHGVTRTAVPSEAWRFLFCLAGGGVTGIAALMRLAGDAVRERA